MQARRPTPLTVSLLWVATLLCATLAAVFFRQTEAFVAGVSSATSATSAEAQGVADTSLGGAHPSPIQFVTVLSGPYRMACDMLAGAVHNGITMNVVGWGAPELNVKDFKKKEEKLKKKIPLLYEHVKDWPNSTVLMFIDGGDVFWQNGAESVFTAYRQLATSQRRIVFSAERNCWIKSLPQDSCKTWPKRKDTPYRYLNSGCWLGELGSVKELLRYVNDTVDHIDPKKCVKCGDQAIFGKAFIADGWNRSITLDVHTSICQNLHMSQDDFCDAPTKTGRVQNCITKSVPALVHFNGNPQHPKLKPDLWKKRMWWHGRKLPAAAAAVVNGKHTRLKELCPKLDYMEEEGGVGSGVGGGHVRERELQHEAFQKRAGVVCSATRFYINGLCYNGVPGTI